jgi:hypothetical protein
MSLCTSQAHLSGKVGGLDGARGCHLGGPLRDPGVSVFSALLHLYVGGMGQGLL